MAQIAVWLKTLIAMVILAGFLELLLPDDQMKSVTKLILGLAILLFLLRPLANLARLPAVLIETLAGTSAPRVPETPATAQVIREGLLLRRQWQRDFKLERRQESKGNRKKSKLSEVNDNGDRSGT
jgi:stage III sporulation protein AF